jgi:hypothetical protein
MDKYVTETSSVNDYPRSTTLKNLLFDGKAKHFTA